MEDFDNVDEFTKPSYLNTESWIARAKKFIKSRGSRPISLMNLMSMDDPEILEDLVNTESISQVEANLITEAGRSQLFYLVQSESGETCSVPMEMKSWGTIHVDDSYLTIFMKDPALRDLIDWSF